MFLFLFDNDNLLLGVVPETVGLLLFGLALIAVTVGLRWFFGVVEKKDLIDENLETITRSINQ